MINYPSIGSRWKEYDKRFERFVIVVSIEPERGVRQVGIRREGTLGPITWARAERFGKSGGYRSAEKAREP